MDSHQENENPILTPSDLSQFTGTTTYYRHWSRTMTYTDGVRFFAEQAGAYWFLDIVATEVMELHKTEPFILVEMRVACDKATIDASDGNERGLWHRDILWTDCPPGLWRFYLCDNVLMVTSEY